MRRVVGLALWMICRGYVGQQQKQLLVVQLREAGLVGWREEVSRSVLLEALRFTSIDRSGVSFKVECLDRDTGSVG